LVDSTLEYKIELLRAGVVMSELKVDAERRWDGIYFAVDVGPEVSPAGPGRAGACRWAALELGVPGRPDRLPLDPRWGLGSTGRRGAAPARGQSCRPCARRHFAAIPADARATLTAPARPANGCGPQHGSPRPTRAALQHGPAGCGRVGGKAKLFEGSLTAPASGPPPCTPHPPAFTPPFLGVGSRLPTQEGATFERPPLHSRLPSVGGPPVLGRPLCRRPSLGNEPRSSGGLVFVDSRSRLDAS
jgi:hypothetical protein